MDPKKMPVHVLIPIRITGMSITGNGNLRILVPISAHLKYGMVLLTRKEYMWVHDILSNLPL
jgi:hypothetical protein